MSPKKKPLRESGGSGDSPRSHGVETTKGTKSTKVRSWAHGTLGTRGKEENEGERETAVAGGDRVEVEG